MTIRDDILAISDAELRRGNIAADYLVHMDFADTPKHWWTGWGEFQADDQKWQGIGDLIGISDLPQSYDITADQVTFTMQGVTAEMSLLARQAQGRVTGRPATVYHQFFIVTPDDDSVQPWSPLIPAFAVFKGKMDQMTFSASRSDDQVMRSIELTAEGLFAIRNASPNGRWTDRDQQRRYPGDLGCVRMGLYENYSPTWNS
ncbi:MAG: hypothetical protein U5N55_11625 [Cypionkella sp.]|nr:hypothetical protein [Cypionkella sp.]